MDVDTLKNHIIDNPEEIEVLLSEAGFCKIKKHKDEYRCAHDAESNPTSIRVNEKTLKANDFSRNVNGDIITLLEDRLSLSFPKTLRWIGRILNIDIGEMMVYTEKKSPFGGFFNRALNPVENSDVSNKIYDESILSNYLSYPSDKFLKSNISIKTQHDYNIGYDVISGRIVIPWRNQFGDIIGIMGRLNKKELNIDDTKYLPVIKFNKDGELYGYSHNYKSIIENDMVVILESEKSTMQLDTMGYKVGLSLGGTAITQKRVKLINSLNVSTVIVAYDEGLNPDIMFDNAKKLKMSNAFFNNRVGVIYDKNNSIIPIGSKSSPTDMGKEVFEQLIREKVIWI